MITGPPKLPPKSFATLCGLLAAFGAVGRGIEELILQILVRRAMERVGAALGYGGDLTRLTVLGIVIYTIDPNFGDGFGGRKGVALDIVVGLVLCGDAINGGFGL